MEGRKTEDYVQVLRKINTIINLKPNMVMSDFEKAERKASEIVFPQAQIIGCFFHYSQVRKYRH